MKKKLLFLLLLLCPFVDFAQDGAIKKDSVQTNQIVYQNQLSIDAEFLYAASLSYTHRISNKWLLGGGLGLGLSFGYTIIKPQNSVSNALGEFLHVEFLGRYEPNKHVQFDFGLRGALITYGVEGGEGAGPILGIYTSVTYGWKYFKIGHRLVITKIGNPILYFLPLEVRVIIPY